MEARFGGISVKEDDWPRLPFLNPMLYAQLTFACYACLKAKPRMRLTGRAWRQHAPPERGRWCPAPGTDNQARGSGWLIGMAPRKAGRPYTLRPA